MKTYEYTLLVGNVEIKEPQLSNELMSDFHKRMSQKYSQYVIINQKELTTKTITTEEWSNIVAKIQFLENKSDRLEREKKELKESAEILLIGVKNQDITIFPNSDKTPDYIQILENTVNNLSE